MSPQSLPEAWRSEAFAEDLGVADEPPPRPRWRYRLSVVLLGVVPVMLATASAAVATWVVH